MSAFTSAPIIALKYWNGRGLMEVPRMLLAINGKFPGDYEDGRFSAPSGDLSANLGRMPLVITQNNECIGQSSAINFYVASESGLMGKSTLETAQIISISEHLKEMIEAFRKLVPWGTEPTSEALNKWFDEGAMDTTGPADRSGQSTRYFQWWSGRIENVLHDSGFAIGNSLTLADVLIYNLFAEYLEESKAAEGLPTHRREAFSDKARTDAGLEKYPKIKASCEAVASNENIKKYLSLRGVQGF